MMNTIMIASVFGLVAIVVLGISIGESLLMRAEYKRCSRLYSMKMATALICWMIVSVCALVVGICMTIAAIGAWRGI